MLRLTTLIDGRKHITFVLQDDANPMIGREETSNDIVLHDKRVSRVHARVVKRADRLLVQDLGSRLGTRLNGQPVTGEQQVRTGDRIEIGPYVLQVELVDWHYDDEEGAMTIQGTVLRCRSCGFVIDGAGATCLSCGQAL